MNLLIMILPRTVVRKALMEKKKVGKSEIVIPNKCNKACMQVGHPDLGCKRVVSKIIYDSTDWGIMLILVLKEVNIHKYLCIMKFIGT